MTPVRGFTGKDLEGGDAGSHLALRDIVLRSVLSGQAHQSFLYPCVGPGETAMENWAGRIIRDTQVSFCPRSL